KHREALNKARTNKEYSAILAAMNLEKADAAKLESAILELMDEVQRLQKEVEGIEAEHGKFLEKVSGAEEVLRAFDEQHADQQTKLNAQREACSDDIAPATLSSFMRVAEHHDGEAMAAIAKLHPKREEYLCEGCNMKVTLEVVNALQTRDEIQPCNNCGRLLYLDPSLVKNAKAKS
ncbi:MAG: hypothetical protein KJ749_00115, partial [Planctomycetes bacterium]|nr:hypothetical protein [Planctomycetota bacterium]